MPRSKDASSTIVSESTLKALSRCRVVALSRCRVVALPGARELIERSRRFAVVTSCPVPLAHARLLAAGLPVPVTLVTPELTKLSKPDPEPYLLGADLLGAVVSECVVLEDAPSGVASGRAAGMTVIAVLTTHTRSELPGADLYITDVTELAAGLDALGISLTA